MELKKNHLPMIRIVLDGEFILGQWAMGNGQWGNVGTLLKSYLPSMPKRR
jgi:hypothetical protein